MDLLRNPLVVLLALLGCILVPACGGGGGGGGGGVTISPANSTITADVTFGALADGADSVTITVTVLSTAGAPITGQTVQLTATGTGNTLTQPAAVTDVNGVATGTISTTLAEVKTVTAVVNPGGGQVTLNDTVDTEFVWPVPGTFFVRTSGSDANAGDSPAEAWATLTHAASLVVPGDTVYVGAGTYNESVTFTTSGSPGHPILVVADVEGFQTGDAGPVIVDAGGADYAIRLFDVSQFALRGFIVTGATPGVLPGGGVWVSTSVGTSNTLYLSGIIAYGNDRGLHVEDTEDSFIESCRISNNLSGDGDGIVLATTDNLVVRNNLIYNNARYGLHLVADCTLISAQINTFHANGSDQVRVGSNCLGVVEDSILSAGFGDGIDTPGPPTSLINEKNNLIWGHTGVGFRVNGIDTALDATDHITNPLFVDPDGADNFLGGAEGADDLFLVGVGSDSIDAGQTDAANVSLSFEGPFTGFTTRSDGFLDGEAPDGAVLNLGVHTPATTTPIGNLAENDARLFYGSGDDVQVLARAWDENTSTWLPPTLSDPVSGTVKWVVSKVSPLFRQAELLAILSDTGTGTELTVRSWNGSFWSDTGGFSDPIICDIQSANVNQRGFDIAYEDQSGDALLVYSNDDNIPVYRSFSQGVWSSESPVLAGAPLASGTVLWVELASRPGTDEIALVYVTEVNLPTDEGDVAAIIWDGNAWQASETLLDNDRVATTRESRCFDVAYESQSGDLLVVWGFTPLTPQVRYATRPGTGGAFTVADLSSADAIGAIVRLAPEPGSDRILAGLSEGSLDNETVGMIWNGSAFVDRVVLDYESAANARDIAVSWVGTTGTGILVYKDDATGGGAGTLDWARFTAPGWQVQADEILPGVGDLEFVQAQSFENQDEVMVLMSDHTGALFALTYDIWGWSFLNGGAALETDLSDIGTSSRPFHFSLKL